MCGHLLFFWKGNEEAYWGDREGTSWKITIGHIPIKIKSGCNSLGHCGIALHLNLASSVQQREDVLAMPRRACSSIPGFWKLVLGDFNISWHLYVKEGDPGSLLFQVF